jgi:hypothetical protein
MDVFRVLCYFWRVKTKFIANSPDEVACVFGPSFYWERMLPRSQPELDERVRLGKFLKATAFTARCRYPIEVYVPTRDQKPDFKVSFGGVAVGIEASKIANPNLEQVRSHQAKDRLGTMQISSLLAEGPPRSFEQMRNDCFGMAPWIFPNPNQLQGEDGFWLKQAQSIIQRKDAISQSPSFNRYAESWLLLWDKLASDEEELQRRSVRLAEFLTDFWHSVRLRRIDGR